MTSKASPVVGADQQDVVVHGGVVGGDAADGDEQLGLGLAAVLLVLQGRQNLGQRAGGKHAPRAPFDLQHVGAVDQDVLWDGVDLHRRRDGEEARGDGHGGGGQRGGLLVLVVLVVALHLDDVLVGHFVRGAELLGLRPAPDPHDGGLAEGDAAAGSLLRLAILHLHEAAVEGEVVDRLLDHRLVVSLHHRPGEVFLARVEASVVGQQGVVTGGERCGSVPREETQEYK